MKIEIVKHYGYRRVRVHYIIEISFIFDNKVYVYYTGNFSAETNEEVLKEMIRLKELFADGRYKIKGSDMMNKLLEDREYTNKETELVYQLFDYKDN